jgi:hypothetical protein
LKSLILSLFGVMFRHVFDLSCEDPGEQAP